MTNNLWFFAVAVGPVLLGCAVVYAMMQQRRQSQAEERQSDRAVQDLYEKPTRRT